MKLAAAITSNPLRQQGAVAIACMAGNCGGYPFAHLLHPTFARLEWRGNEEQVHPGEGAT